LVARATAAGSSARARVTARTLLKLARHLPALCSFR